MENTEEATSEPQGSADITDITAASDLILDVKDETRDQTFSYRVSTIQLKQASPYFASLLDPHKFGEGARVDKELRQLKKKYDDFASVPADQLPRVSISDVGRISRVNSIKPLMSDFLCALHGLELSTPNPPIPNLANIAIVADRFDALPFIAHYMRRKRFFQAIDAKTKGKSTSLNEERGRQKIFIGLLLDYPPWVSIYSKRLIIGGSVQWKPDVEEDLEAALWWDLPRGIEGNELTVRSGL